MKKPVSSVIIVLLLLSMSSIPAAAGSDFALVDGVVDTSKGAVTLAELDFWKNLRIEFNGQNPDTQDIRAVGEGYYTEEGVVFTASGEITGTYVSQNGYFQGTFYLISVMDDPNLGWYNTSRFDGSFAVFLKPGQDQVTIQFKATETYEMFVDGESISKGTKQRDTFVTFKVEGGISMIQPTPTMTFEDSGARFSDLSGQVEILVPCGLKPDGDYDYCDETWEWAKFDLVLPEGTMIRTQEKSSCILSFADMTTFVQQPDTTIILSKAAQKDSQFKLLVGTLWVNVKKMLKDGSMDIEMSQAVCGIKGTTFVLEDDGSTSTLKVIEGTVEFTALSNGESRMVKAGEMISANPQGLGEIQVSDVNNESGVLDQFPPDEQNVDSGAPFVTILPYGSIVETPPPGDTEEVTSPPADGFASVINKFIKGARICLSIFIVLAVVVVVLLLRKRSKKKANQTPQ